jgi:hypothetical protein
MGKKKLEALVVGILIWLAGALLITLFGQSPFFPVAALPAAFMAVPAMYVITRLYLRNIPLDERRIAAIRLGVIVTAVQFPLDTLGWLVILKLGFPPLTAAAREAVILSLEVGYFWLLIVPWWAGNRR